MGWHGFARMLTEVAGSLRDVLLPRGCAGCDMPDAVLCDDCRASGGGFMSFAMPGTVSGRAIACGAYRGPLRRAILRWKDHGDEECDGPFADMMADALLSSGLLASDPMPVTTLVPAPSSPRSMRERGRWHMRNVTNSLARSLRRRGMDVDTAALLRTTKTSGKSVQMHGAAQRSRRLQGHIVIAARPPYPRNVILVDDMLHDGKRIRRLAPLLRQTHTQVDQVLVGYLTGMGRDLMEQLGYPVDSIYYLPNLRRWFVESTLYPFIGGDTVRRPGRLPGGLQPSVNRILPYASPELPDVDGGAVWQLSLCCLENARDILLALETEYRSLYARNLTLARLGEAVILPLCPDKGPCMTYDLTRAASTYLDGDIEQLRRMR